MTTDARPASTLAAGAAKKRVRLAALLMTVLVATAVASSAAAAPPARPDLNPLFAAEWWLRGHATVTDWLANERPSDGVDAVSTWPESSGEGVVVVVADSGVDLSTPALDGRLLPGLNFLTGRKLTGDPCGHGTHVATIIAGNPRYGDGIFGVAPDVHILPLRIGTAAGHVVDSAAAAALRYALRDPRVRVINMSWGKAYSPALAYALRAVARQGSILLVSAAGNDAAELSQSHLLPQTFDSESELTVASSDLFDELSLFSNYGTHVEVAAPGERILSAFPGDTLKIADGTSMAAPMVSGVAALLFASYPQASAAQVKQAIVTSCTPAAELTGRVGCGGIVNARRAIETLRASFGRTEGAVKRVQASSGDDVAGRAGGSS